MSDNYSQIYPGNIIHPTAIIYPAVKMGKGNIIGAHCIIGDAPESVKYFDKENFGVLIGDGCRFTKQVTIDGGTESPTTIGNNVLMLKNAHVGHDSIIGDGVELRCNAMVGGHVKIGEESKLMLCAVVHPRQTIPDSVTIGACCFVSKKTILESGNTYVGIPAKKLVK